MVWAVAVGTGGYLFGNALEVMIGNIKHYELQAFGAVAVTGTVVWALYFYHRRKKRLSAVKN
jgi:membrane protein DedA with SNARE-associated domain